LTLLKLLVTLFVLSKAAGLLNLQLEILKLVPGIHPVALVWWRMANSAQHRA
jgi:hypothetical protein